MLSARERAVWAAGFALAAAVIVLTGFLSDDPDSALYAALAGRLAEGPAAHWIAPEWWGHWDSEGLFREHPAGIFLLPVLLSRAGLPAAQAAYVVGLGASLACLLLIGRLVSRLTSPAEGRAALVLLQLMPVAFIFRIRANHEYLMLLCLLAVLVALDGVRRTWRWLPLVAVAFTAALLVKGVFVVLVGLGAMLWVLANPARVPGSIARPLAAGLAAAGVMAIVAVGYDAWYLAVTGERFWAAYWQRQLGPLELASPVDEAATLAGHAGFYVSRLLWHPAPWSLALVAAAWRWRRTAAARWRALPDSERRALVFVLAFAALTVATLSPSSRFAERYAFSAAYAVAAAGAVAAWRIWPRLAGAVDRLDARVPALPAVLWTGLVLLRLVTGSLLPRLSIQNLT